MSFDGRRFSFSITSAHCTLQGYSSLIMKNIILEMIIMVPKNDGNSRVSKTPMVEVVSLDMRIRLD